MSTKCIGIISYLPDDPELREIRKSRLLSLLKQCDDWFKIPIIIVAQNWGQDIDLKVNNSKLIVYRYKNRLGITGARLALVDKFLSSSYDRIIFMDDDMVLNNPEEVHKYLTLLGDKDFYYIPGWLCNFCSISRHGLSIVNFDPNTSAENLTGFEDWLFLQTCIKKLSNGKINCKLGRGVRRNYLDDKYSTWNPSGIYNSSRNSSVTSLKIRKIK